jgi:hypothetical protein
MLCEDDTARLGIGEAGVAIKVAIAEDGSGGAGDGVMNEVDKMVSASCVATGSPFGLRKVIAGMTCVTTVR